MAEIKPNLLTIKLNVNGLNNPIISRDYQTEYEKDEIQLHAIYKTHSSFFPTLLRYNQ